MATEVITPYQFDDHERHATAMREVVETLVLMGEDSQQFSALHANRDFTDKPPIVRLNAMFTGCNSPEQKYATYQLAAANPDRSVIDIDVPAHGYSDRLTDAQFREVIGKRTLSLVGRSQLLAVLDRVPDIKELVAVGDSLGARVGFDFVSAAQESDIQAQHLVCFDPIGLERRPTLGVTKSYFLSEYFNSSRIYDNTNASLLHNAAYEVSFKNELERFGFKNDFSMPEVFKRDPRILLFLLARSPLSADTGRESLQGILETDEGLKASIVVGGLSTICRWRKIQDWAEGLQSEHPDQLDFNVWPDDAHGMSLAPQQPRMAAYVKSQLDTPWQSIS